MAGDKAIRGLTIAVVTPSPGKTRFLLLTQNRKFLNLSEIMRQSVSDGRHWLRDTLIHFLPRKDQEKPKEGASPGLCGPECRSDRSPGSELGSGSSSTRRKASRTSSKLTAGSRTGRLDSAMAQ